MSRARRACRLSCTHAPGQTGFGGSPAEAEILAIEETGITVQGNYPMGKSRLRVHPPDGEPYEVTAKCLLNRFEVPAYQPGTTVRVLIDPRHRRRVTLA